MLPRNLGININNTVPKKAALIREAVRFERKKYGQDEKSAIIFGRENGTFSRATFFTSHF